MDMGVGGSSGASWTFDIKKRVMFHKRIKRVSGSHIYLGFKVGDSKYPTVK